MTPPPRRHPRGQETGRVSEDEVSEFEEIMAAIGDGDDLRPRERQFVQDQAQRYEEDGPAMRLSEAQWRWLRDIRDRV